VADESRSGEGQIEGHTDACEDHCSHDHNHKPAQQQQQQPQQQVRTGPPPRPSCGFADPAELKAAAAAAAAVPQESLEVKNVKKVRAIEATREHGKQLFEEGNFQHAYAVYERGILIANGCFSLTDEQQAAVDDHEFALELNMAACMLKLGNPTKALSHARVASRLQPKSVKAHYRIAVAHVDLVSYDKAREELEIVENLDPGNAGARALRQRIAKEEREAASSERQVAAAMARGLGGKV
jgi:tetratricopeptide (TPR) repeat protein